MHLGVGSKFARVAMAVVTAVSITIVACSGPTPPPPSGGEFEGNALMAFHEQITLWSGHAGGSVPFALALIVAVAVMLKLMSGRRRRSAGVGGRWHDGSDADSDGD